MQSSPWLHVIDAKILYNVLLERPWIHKNKVVPSAYHKCLKYYEVEVEKTVVADDEPFTEAESHFADAKFYLKNRIVKELKADDGIKSNNKKPSTKREEVNTGEAKVVSKENVALPTKRTDEGFNPNTYKIFAKAGYNPNEPSKLGKLPLEAATRKPREGLGYKMRRQTKLVVSYKEVLKVKPYTVVYTKEYDEYKESMGSSYHVTIQVESGIPCSMEDNAELEDVSPCYHISFNDGDPQEDEDVSSIVLVRKKNSQIRVCVDFRDLNNACPKDEFPLPIPELMIDATTGYDAMLFMDGSSGYNQIRMAPKDEELTGFRTPKGIYCYKVMPFGLKNIGATYQRAMQNIFDDLLHKNVECYVDDLVVKSREKGDHMKGLRMLKHYFQAHIVHLISKANPIKFVMSKPVLSDRLARWYLQFQQFEILDTLQKAVKGQALADFLADHPIPDDWELTDELLEEDVMVVEVQPPWKMYFDGAAHRGGAGAGIVFVTPQGEVLPYSFTLIQLFSNNVAEYQALILGLEMAVDMKQLQLQVFGDSQLVVNQLLGSYEVKKPELGPYHDYAKKLMGWLSDVTIQEIK
ncbi:uncharacterized protein [Nicotiana sylvestris]|uniref:uncharacterized protein n=1 Tax=Nicotiana sylvestris TaxID=4096 RepID=UPI00388C6483